MNWIVIFWNGTRGAFMLVLSLILMPYAGMAIARMIGGTGGDGYLFLTCLAVPVIWILVCIDVIPMMKGYSTATAKLEIRLAEVLAIIILAIFIYYIPELKVYSYLQ